MNSPRRTQGQTKETTEGMHLCPSCRSDLVQPLEWSEQSSDSWSVELRCPECEWRGNGTYAQAEIDRYDRLLDDGSRSLSGDLRTLTRENMEREIETFIAALDSGAILPEDF